MTDNVIQVLTSKSIAAIMAAGGTESWALNRSRARACKYAVCCRNASSAETQGNEAHGSAFVIGLISDVVPSNETEGRWLVQFSKYALVAVDDQWEGRNPVRFYTTDDYAPDINFDDLNWIVMPASSVANASAKVTRGLSIAEAKAGLAEFFNVDPSAIEIMIRG